MLMDGFFNDDLFNGFFGEFARPARTVRCDNGMMSTDIRELDDAYELEILLPGFKKENVQAELRDGRLTVTANREDKQDEGKYLRRECYRGSCSRTFFVGRNLRQEDIKAHFEDGVLKISVPKYRPEENREENLIAIEG